MSTQRKTVLITRRTRLEELVAQYNTESQAEFVIQSRGQDFNTYKQEYLTYQSAIQQVEDSIKPQTRLQRLDREFLPNFIFAPDDIIVVLGQDGLVANTLKYLNGQPVIAINPDPTAYDGILLPFQINDTSTILSDVLNNTTNSKAITLAKATLNDGQALIAVNDFFIGPKTQTSARYDIEFNGQREVQSSSGVVVSTGLGSTGWLTSIMRGAEKIAGVTPQQRQSPVFAWASKSLKFAVREPFPSNTTGAELVYGEVNKRTPLTIHSFMANNGIIFSDGIIDDGIGFTSGQSVSFTTHSREGQLIV